MEIYVLKTLRSSTRHDLHWHSRLVETVHAESKRLVDDRILLCLKAACGTAAKVEDK